MATETKKIPMAFDWPLLLAALFLNFVGLLNLASAAPSTTFWHRQLFSFVVGLGMMLMVAGVNYRFFERAAYPIYGSTLFLLLVTDIIGTVAGGTQGWIRLGVFSLQPSELAKIGTILALAKFFHDQRKGGPYTLRQLRIPILIGLLPAILIMRQPDLGTTVMLMFVVGGVILFMGVRKQLIYIAVTLALIGAPLSWKIMAPHQKNRIMAFVDPHSDPTGIGYNVIQSMVAIGSGKLTGKGFTLGSQTELRYLPECHTDFIFSVLAEEWGFIGVVITLLAFLFILLWGLNISKNAKDRFGALTALGVVLMLFCHTAINVAMTVGAFPVVGIPLPFMSYGGSFLITVMVGIGLLMSIQERRRMF